MMRIDSRDMDKLNQQVACSDLFGGGGRKEGFQPALPEVERSPSRAFSARSERIGKHFATDRYLSRGERSMPPLFPVARCWDCCHFSAPHIEGRNGPCRIY